MSGYDIQLSATLPGIWVLEWPLSKIVVPDWTRGKPRRYIKHPVGRLFRRIAPSILNLSWSTSSTAGRLALATSGSGACAPLFCGCPHSHPAPIRLWLLTDVRLYTFLRTENLGRVFASVSLPTTTDELHFEPDSSLSRARFALNFVSLLRMATRAPAPLAMLSSAYCQQPSSVPITHLGSLSDSPRTHGSHRVDPPRNG
ncbi:hypothetical protein C8Q79DRAFT_448571 [Trametes meyenii]|nr:hypothetical protein C8Q79DRAFT_448571 [Trametes meyenii]